MVTRTAGMTVWEVTELALSSLQTEDQLPGKERVWCFYFCKKQTPYSKSQGCKTCVVSADTLRHRIHSSQHVYCLEHSCHICLQWRMCHGIFLWYMSSLVASKSKEKLVEGQKSRVVMPTMRLSQGEAASRHSLQSCNLFGKFFQHGQTSWFSLYLKRHMYVKMINFPNFSLCSAKWSQSCFASALWWNQFQVSSHGRQVLYHWAAAGSMQELRAVILKASWISGHDGTCL